LTKPPQQHHTVWYIGDRWKDMQAAWAAQKERRCQIIPFAYGLNATLHAFVDGKLSPPQRILDYEDLLVTLGFIFDKETGEAMAAAHSSLPPD
jgi:phosphoglycolate phosphatase